MEVFRSEIKIAWVINARPIGVITRLMKKTLTEFGWSAHLLPRNMNLKIDIASANILQTAINRVKVRVGSTTVMSFSFFWQWGLFSGLNKVINDEITWGN